MTAPTTETAPAPARRGGGALSRKAGPLPVWGWVVLAIAGVGGYIIYRRSKAAGAANTAATTATSSAVPPETAIPVPENAGISQAQYAQLLDQDRALFESIQDLQGPKSKPRDKDAEEDKESKGQEAEENEKPRCPKGYHFLAVPAGSDIFPAGGKAVKGGFCVPDRKK